MVRGGWKAFAGIKPKIRVCRTQFYSDDDDDDDADDEVQLVGINKCEDDDG